MSDVDRKRRNNGMALKLGAMAVGAFAFGFALVPLYDVLCDVTGFGNQKRLAERAVATERPDKARTVSSGSCPRRCRSIPGRRRRLRMSSHAARRIDGRALRCRHTLTPLVARRSAARPSCWG